MSACFPLCASTQIKPAVTSSILSGFQSERRQKHRFAQKPAAHSNHTVFTPIISGRTNHVFKSARATVFATLMSEFGNQTVLGFWIVQELTLWHKDRRTGRWAIALRHHEWGFYCFFNYYRIGIPRTRCLPSSTQDTHAPSSLLRAYNIRSNGSAASLTLCIPA